MKKILLVDDDELFGEMVHKTLTAFGYEVLRARGGKEALELYDPLTVDLVLTDLIMPDMEGVELIMALRRLQPGVKVIAMSGGGRNRPEVYLQIAQRIGALRTLAKPFPLATLRAAVEECLAEKKSEES
ncbi:MAG: response regulator [Verrucomicrobia bacterium]|nr:response regulator [Verrucomicrobiota bacterium]